MLDTLPIGETSSTWRRELNAHSLTGRFVVAMWSLKISGIYFWKMGEVKRIEALSKMK